MFEFVLYSRKGHTAGGFTSLFNAGRLDIVYQCILTSIFRSHAHRHDVVFHAFLNGPPVPPKHIEISGKELFDVRLDERSWEALFQKILAGGDHQGITVKKESLHGFIRERAEAGVDIYILEERGTNITNIEFKEAAVFILGDHIGLPKNDEKYLLRFGKKLSLGKHKYLAASCIDIINYTLDRYFLDKYNMKRR